MADVFQFFPQQTQIKQPVKTNSKPEIKSGADENNKLNSVFDNLVRDEISKTKNDNSTPAQNSNLNPNQKKFSRENNNPKTSLTQDAKANLEDKEIFNFAKNTSEQTILNLLAMRLTSEQPQDNLNIPVDVENLTPELDFEGLDAKQLEEIFNALKQFAEENGLEISDDDLKVLSEIFAKMFIKKANPKNSNSPEKVLNADEDLKSEIEDDSDDDDNSEITENENANDYFITAENISEFMTAIIAENGLKNDDTPEQINTAEILNNDILKNSRQSNLNEKIFASGNFQNVNVQKNNNPESKKSDAVKNVSANDESNSEDTTKIQNFRQTLDNRSQNSNSDENQEEQPNNDFAFQFENNNSRRTNNNTRNSNSNSRNTVTNDYSRSTSNNYSTRTETAHNNFQTFFEDVLNNRRINNSESTTPLNLRAGVNFTQSGILREGITNVVRFIRADGIQKANMIIDPPALGRVSVELSSTSSGVEASIKVASEQIRLLVQSQITQLRMNLAQQGVQVTEFTVDVQQDGAQQNSQDGYNNRDNNNRYRGFNGDDEDDGSEEFRIDLNDGLLYWVA